MVTALRTDVDTVVTEYGVAQVKDLPNQARAEALINIAAPQFRDELRASLQVWSGANCSKKKAYSSASSSRAVKRPD